MNTTKPGAIPAPKEHHDLRARTVRAPQIEQSERANHTRPVDSRPTLTMQRQLIASLVG